MTRLITVSLMLVALAGFALAGNPSPEVDPASGVAAIALVSGGLLVLRSRRRKQQ